MENKLAIINPGTQYTQQAYKRLKEKGFDSKVFDVSPREDKATGEWTYPTVDESALEGFAGYLIMGSRHSVHGPVIPKIPDIFKFERPVLGICYGTQHMAHIFGGTVKNGRRQYGPTKTEVDLSCPVFAGLEDNVQQVCMSHGDHVDEPPEGFKVVASSKHLFDNTSFTDAIYNPERNIYGFQFHPEVFLTTNGAQMLENFAGICGLEPHFETEVKGIDYKLVLEERIKYIEDILTGNNSRVLCPVSGGVDSSVAAALAMKTSIATDRFYMFHIDTGLNRLRESEKVVQTYRKKEKMNLPVELVDAKEFVLNWQGDGDIPLRKATDDKLKRKLFQQAYQKVISFVIEENGFDAATDYVLQGTLETDKVESGRGKGSSGSAEIKRHHNVGGPLDGFQHIEPNAIFFKDQVRQVAALLGLPDEIVHRPPFPGPGNCVRIASYDAQRPVRQDFSYVEERAMKTAQHFGFEAYVSPLVFVGTMGDERGEGYMAVVQNQEDVDWNKLFELSTQIPWYSVGRDGSCITRVVYALDKINPLEARSLTPTFVDEEELQILQRAENIFSTNPKVKNNKKVSQNVVYLTPNNFGQEGKRSVGLRPVYTPDFMTLRPTYPEEISMKEIEKIMQKILEDPKVADVFYDITYKPNGSTEPF